MLGRIAVASDKPLRVNTVEEERLYLQAVHEVIGCILEQRRGRTLVDIAETIEADKKTISNAFNKTHRLNQMFLFRLGRAFGSDCLDPVAALLGARFTPREVDETVDALPSTTAAIHKLALAGSDNSPGGRRIVHTELLDMEDEVDAAIRALSAIKARCEKARAA
jgi:UDP-glucose 6-dehydrogenase